MKKILPYLALVPMVALALIPPVDFGIRTPVPLVTTWLILVSAFFGFYTLFLKTSIFVKIIAVGGFINCFFSTMPYMSFISYISLVACCYFYILCTKIDNWTPIFRALQIVVFLNVGLLLIQLTGHDKLLNFGLAATNCFGTIGACNQIGGLLNSITALLVSFNPVYFIVPLFTGIAAQSMGTFLAGVAGISIWVFSRSERIYFAVVAAMILFFIITGIKQGDFYNGKDRVPMWKKTIELTNRHPVAGWGMGSYKYIMAAFSRSMGKHTWRMAHNSFLQLGFEFGYPALALITAMVATLIYQLIKIKAFACLSGLGIIITDGMVHFPDRQIQVVLILIAFFAYCVRKINKEGHCGEV